MSHKTPQNEQNNNNIGHLKSSFEATSCFEDNKIAKLLNPCPSEIVTFDFGLNCSAHFVVFRNFWRQTNHLEESCRL